MCMHVCTWGCRCFDRIIFSPPILVLKTHHNPIRKLNVNREVALKESVKSIEQTTPKIQIMIITFLRPYRSLAVPQIGPQIASPLKQKNSFRKLINAI